ncbi:MAG: hypothetical protein ACLPTM_16090 [Steroidobacteraceae bacterium]
MTPLPELAPDAMSGAAEGEAPPTAAAAGPFVLNLCSSSTPMALAQTELPELKRFNFFVSRRFEEGRERFRLHMGYFATLAEAEEWLNVVREIYPGAWAGEAPGRKLRERAAAAAAEQARHAAGPQPRVAPSAPRAAVRAPAPVKAPAGPPPAVRVPVVHAAPQQPVRAASRPAVAAAPRQPAPVASPPRMAAAPAARPRPAQPVVPQAGARPPAARSAPIAHTVPAARPGAGVAPRPAAPSRAAAPAARAGAGRAPVKPVFEDSNVRDVLAALGENSTTGETRLMHAPQPPRAAPAADSSLSDTQVLRVLEERRPDDGGPADGQARNIPLLKPDDTGTRRALKAAVVANAPVWFAVQLQWSVQPVELDKVPPLAIFGAYTLYTVEGSREGRHWYGLRLGFFSDAISAKQVAYYVRSEFGSVAVVPVSPAERTRATEADRKATRLASPEAPRRADVEEFKLIDAKDEPAAPAAARLLAVNPAARSPARAAPSAAAARARGRVGARERRGGPSLEETLEILGATELTIEDDSRETINDTGVRHLQVEVQKNSPFVRLLDRLSERMKKS